MSTETVDDRPTTAPTPAGSRHADVVELLARYCRGLDSGNKELLAEVFHQNSTLNRPDGSAFSGQQAIVEVFADAASHAAVMRHYVLNIEIQDVDIQDDDIAPDALRASGNSWIGSVLARYICPVLDSPTGSRVTLGRYEDLVCDTSDGMKILRKNIFVDAVIALPADAVKVWAQP